MYLTAISAHSANAIDVHSHIVTDEYIDCLRRHNALMEDGYPLPSWSEESHLAFMDSAGIAKSVLTLSSPQPWFGNVEECKSVIRSVDATPSGICSKQPMQPDGIVRLSKIEVYPEYLDKYLEFATEVGEKSLQTEPGVLTMYAVADKENPCNITILETYASQEAYKKHIASAHFQKYKQGTLHMVKSLVLDDVTPLNPDNQLINYIEK